MSSPFKFLAPYDLEDREYFFGRDGEIEELYKLIFESNLILVYGASGVGKTSLVQCGLASRFLKTDWFDLHVRRRENINESLRHEIRKSVVTPLEENDTLPDMIESLFLDYFKPVFLIFDQFEELYILGDKEERAQFIEDIAELIESDLNCKVIIVMREEFIAQLYDFEQDVPRLFDKRLRVEPMNFANVEQVIRGSAKRFGVQLEPEGQTIKEIIAQVSEGKSGVQLAHLQIYLDRLYQEAE